jgi:hypothetical protein
LWMTQPLERINQLLFSLDMAMEIKERGLAKFIEQRSFSTKNKWKAN